jgi:uncharacterized circularly permuted ATP-grasp superfamily protein/uncharacterized alpha-E superfamily protein
MTDVHTREDASAFGRCYHPAPGLSDEFFESGHQPRSAAAPLVAFLDEIGSAGLRQRTDQVRQLVRDHGVSYSVPGHGPSSDRPWCLDVLPALLDSGEFSALARGLAERAHLLDRILKDLYGPQRLIREGYLPARLVLGNPTFLRPCHGVDLASHLHLYAADLVRTAGGALCVLRDRTQAPTGVGYALENRLVISHVLEEPFRQGNILRLASFFRTLRESLAALSPALREDPHIVLLSSGAYSPTYFEQAFLAQYLGYPLVEGGDLTVREHRVFLKTLGGLSPVDVIFRQPEDDYCDPLELRPDSQLGVPGLVEATRARQVAVANPLGSGLAQSPALLPFLPRIARDFFGEGLSLASAPSYWCGDQATLDHVLAHLDAMVFRPAWSGAGPSLLFAGRLEGQAKESFLSRLRANPENFIAQEQVALAQSPVMDNGEVVPRPSLLRGYAVCTGQDYVAMPGGLCLVASATGDPDVAVARGALAKDLWVRGEAPADRFSLLPPAARSVELSRGGADLPSRSADNLLWLGRYAERAEALARLARHLLSRLADEGEARVSASPAMPPLFELMASATDSPPLASPQEPPLLWLARALCSPEPTGSLHNTVRAATRSAAAVRDRLSSDTFRVLGALGDEVERATALVAGPSVGALTGLLDRVVTSLSALSGLAMESMTRGHGWRFLDMGRRLERALQMLSLLQAAFAAGAENNSTLLETLLAVADSSITYRRRYLAGLHPAAVVDLLLVDDSNPRAVLFQLAALREHLHHLPHDPAQARLRPEERLALAALTRLQLLDVMPACQTTAQGGPPPLHAILHEIETALSTLSEELCGSYLSHALMPRPLAVSSSGG